MWCLSDMQTVYASSGLVAASDRWDRNESPSLKTGSNQGFKFLGSGDDVIISNGISHFMKIADH